MPEWQVQKAKAEFSALIEAAQREPQIVTKHGEPVAAVLSHEAYLALKGQAGRPSLVSFLRQWPPFEVPERDRSPGREIDW